MKDTGKSLAFTPITHVPHLRFPYLCKQVSTFISFFYILSVSWIFFFFFLTTSHHMQDLISMTSDQTRTPCSESSKCQPLDHRGSPPVSFCMQVEASFKMCIHYLLNPLFHTMPHLAHVCLCQQIFARQYREISYSFYSWKLFYCMDIPWFI